MAPGIRRQPGRFPRPPSTTGQPGSGLRSPVVHRATRAVDIYTVGLSNTFPTNVTNNHPANDTWPSWSPDSQRITFVSNRDGDDDIWAINSDGTGSLQLTNDPAVDSGPVWSPDGSKIAFWSTRAEDADIYVKRGWLGRDPGDHGPRERLLPRLAADSPPTTPGQREQRRSGCPSSWPSTYARRPAGTGSTDRRWTTVPAAHRRRSPHTSPSVRRTSTGPRRT